MSMLMKTSDKHVKVNMERRNIELRGAGWEVVFSHGVVGSILAFNASEDLRCSAAVCA